MLDLLLSMIAGNVIYPLIIPGLMAGTMAIIISFYLPSVLATYKVPTLLGGIVAVLFFTFYGGKYSEESKHKIAEAELNTKIAILEGKAAEVTHDVEIRYVDRIKEVEKIKVEYKDGYVDRFITKEDNSKCIINNGFVRLHDSAANGEVPGPAKGTDEDASEFKLSDVGRTVTYNYLTFKEVRDQLIGLQDWVNRQKTLMDTAK